MNYTNNTTCSPREQVIRNVLQLIRKQELPPDAEVPAAEAGATVPRRKAKPVVKIVPEDAAAQGAAEPGQPASKRLRKPRRKKEEPEHKELFAFYEQSLF